MCVVLRPVPRCGLVVVVWWWRVGGVLVVSWWCVAGGALPRCRLVVKVLVWWCQCMCVLRGAAAPWCVGGLVVWQLVAVRGVGVLVLVVC